jgi:hypothetical protein
MLREVTASVSANGREALCGSPFPWSPPTVDGEVMRAPALSLSVGRQTLVPVHTYPHGLLGRAS